MYVCTHGAEPQPDAGCGSLTGNKTNRRTTTDLRDSVFIELRSEHKPRPFLSSTQRTPGQSWRSEVRGRGQPSDG